MMDVILATFTGFIVGVIFSFLKLPIPAPPVLPGVMGIVGVYLGHEAYALLVKQLAS